MVGASTKRARNRRQRDALLLFAVSALLIGNLLRLGLGVWPQHAAALSTETAPTTPIRSSTQTYAAGADTDLVQAVARAEAAYTTCTGAAYTAPESIDLSGRPTGLTSIVDTPDYYHVQAADIDTMRQRIFDCPYRQATGPYHGFTTYRLSWTYSTVVMSGGLCRLSNIKVGLHVNQLLPELSSSDPTLANRSSTFMQNLAAHEQGHVTIDQRYAQELTDALGGLGTMSCNLLNTQATLTINTKLAQLDAANELYDSSTDHGATQGAVL